MEQEFLKSLHFEKVRLQKLLDAINTLIQNYQTTAGILKPADPLIIDKKTVIKLNRPTKIKKGYKPYYDALEADITPYSKDFTNVQKTVFALKSLQEGDKYGLADFLLSVDSNLKRDRLVSFIGNHCSRMSIEGVIGAKKQGNKNLYYIK